MTPRLMLLPLAFALVATVTFASGESDQPAAAAEKDLLDHHRLGDHRGGELELPGVRAAAGRAELGHHAEP